MNSFRRYFNIRKHIIHFSKEEVDEVLQQKSYTSTLARIAEINQRHESQRHEPCIEPQIANETAYNGQNPGPNDQERASRL